LQIDALEKELTPGDLAAKTVQEVVNNIKNKMKAVFGSATEFNFSVRKNFDGSYSRTYLVDGRANRILNSKTRNPPWDGDHAKHYEHAVQPVPHPCFHGHSARRRTKGRVSYTTRRMDYHDGAKAMVQETQKVKEMWEDTITAQGEKRPAPVRYGV
jgi:hypothetical protein